MPIATTPRDECCNHLATDDSWDALLAAARILGIKVIDLSTEADKYGGLVQTLDEDGQAVEWWSGHNAMTDLFADLVDPTNGQPAVGLLPQIGGVLKPVSAAWFNAFWFYDTAPGDVTLPIIRLINTDNDKE